MAAGNFLFFGWKFFSVFWRRKKWLHNFRIISLFSLIFSHIFRIRFRPRNFPPPFREGHNICEKNDKNKVEQIYPIF